jgi:hypothetical protein
MGMFDYINYKGNEYQTKDTSKQLLDHYKIETDQESGHEYLWYEEYDAEYIESEDYFLGGYLKQFNQHWVRCDNYDGLIRFYRPGNDKKTWIEYSALFMDGKIIKFTDTSYETNTNKSI